VLILINFIPHIYHITEIDRHYLFKQWPIDIFTGTHKCSGRPWEHPSFPHCCTPREHVNLTVLSPGRSIPEPAVDLGGAPGTARCRVIGRRQLAVNRRRRRLAGSTQPASFRGPRRSSPGPSRMVYNCVEKD